MRKLEEFMEVLRAKGVEVWVAGAASAASIEKLQNTLGVTLPPTYREFLAKWGAVSVVDSSISGVIGNDPLEKCGGSVFGDTMHFKETWQLPSGYIIIQADEDAPHCLDVNAKSHDKECDVVCFELHSRNATKIASSFQEWVEKFFISEKG